MKHTFQERKRGLISAALLCLVASVTGSMPQCAGAAIADSIDDWSSSGFQGENNWYYGFYNLTADSDGTYSSGDFIPFFNDGSGSLGPGNQWTGSDWQLVGYPGSTDDPWTALGVQSAVPHGTNSLPHEEHWVIRRWVSTVSQPVRIETYLDNVQSGGTGVTNLLFINGNLVLSSMASYQVAVTRHIDVTLAAGDIVDLAVSPEGRGGDRSDIRDYAFNRLTIDVAPAGPSLDGNVDAGPDQTLSCGGFPCSTSLAGTVQYADTGSSFLIVKWIVTRAPGVAVLDDPADLRSTVSFDRPGTYILQLNVNDGQTSGSDLVTINVQGDTGPSSGGCAILTHLPFNAGTGPTAYDASGHQRNGSLMGDPLWTQGPPGFYGALALDGDDYVELDDEAAFDATDALTVAAWVNIERVRGYWTGIVTKGTTAWRLSTLYQRRQFHFAVSDPAAGAHWINGDRAVNANEWHHLAGTYDGEQIRLYIDGEEDPVGPVAYGGPVSTNDRPVWIGANAEFSNAEFIGKIDEVRIFNRALSWTEIQGLLKPEGRLWIREVIDNGPVPDQTAAFASLDSGNGTTVDYQIAVLNVLDGGENGHFTHDYVFGVVEEGLRQHGAVENLSMEASGFIRIPADQAGDWTFGVNSDDGFTLMFPDHSFDTATNGELTSFPLGTALRYAGIRPAQDTLGTIKLPAGDHLFWLIYHEHLGGAGLEFFAAHGIHDSFDPEVFRLVGQRPICDLAVPGLCGHADMVVTEPGAWGAIRSLTDARSALAQGQQTQVSTELSVINHSDPDFGGPLFGTFPHDGAFPNDRPGRNEDDFAVRVTGQLDIPAAGTYQIGFNSDDGVSLRIPGQTWTAIIEDATGHAVTRGDELTNDAVTARSFTVAEIELPAGCHAFEVIMFEGYGGAFLELLGRGVSPMGDPDPTWHLLKTGGARFPVDASGLQLLPEDQ